MAYTTIDDPSAYFQTKTYTGSAGAQSITFDGNSDLQPDWIWIKERGAAGGHVVTDTVRGISASSAPFLQPSSTGAEIDANGTEANRTLTSSNTNGFTLGQDAYYTNFNNNSDTYVSWNWKAGTSFTNDASSTGIGSIDSAGSANDTAGFSIVTYTGTGSNGTIKHGLSTAPKMIITHQIGGGEWYTYHTGIASDAETDFLNLHVTVAVSDDAEMWNDTKPTTSVFSVGVNGNTNGSSDATIAYCFAEKQGYSKFSSYVGNGSDTPNGVFIWLGFKPAFILIKATDSNSWVIVDNKRPADSNPVDSSLAADSTAAETTGDSNTTFDFLSNGFRTNGNSGNNNSSGQKYIYMAFAENPFVTSTGVPATAR